LVANEEKEANNMSLHVRQHTCNSGKHTSVAQTYPHSKAEIEPW